MTLPVRVPQTTGHTPRPEPLRSASSYLHAFADTVSDVVYVPNRRFAAQRGNFMDGVAKGSAATKRRRAIESAAGERRP